MNKHPINETKFQIPTQKVNSSQRGPCCHPLVKRRRKTVQNPDTRQSKYAHDKINFLTFIFNPAVESPSYALNFSHSWLF
jgi:hypothetical protein